MFFANHMLVSAAPSQYCFTRGSVKTLCERSADALFAPRNGTQTAYTRRFAAGSVSKISLCTQLAPARHVVQVGESSRMRRTVLESWLNACRSMAIEERSRT